MFMGFGSFLLMSADATQQKKLRHVVMFKFKPEVSQEQMEKVSNDFYALKEKIPQIIEFEGGADIHFREKDTMFTHCFIVTVRDEKDLAVYGAHPDHQAFSESALLLLAEVALVDYWTD
jgi:hypothetical protein